MAATDTTYALILAGGSGTRFWPLSRNSRPKQLLDLFGDGNLLIQTIRRLDGLVPPENILVLTNIQQLVAVRQAATMLPAENIIAEPAKRDTAPAVALGIGLIAARNPEALMIVLPADQLIRDTAAFQADMRNAMAVAAASDGLVTIGIPPTWPCPSYGYIERGQAQPMDGVTRPPYVVKRFREKPNTELAQQFLNQGNFSWNAGMFVWSLPTVIKQLEKHTPELGKFIADLCGTAPIERTIASRFPDLTATSIDYALLEKADSVFNLDASFDWDDIGSWISIARYLDQQGEDNRANQLITHLDAVNNIVFNARPQSRIALLGVDDLIVVQTEDALLIANRHQADAIKDLTAMLPPGLL